jgi:hypothetical protein
MKRKTGERPFSFPINTLAGSSFSNLTNIQKDHQIDPGYRKKFIFSALVSLVLEPFRVYENWVYSGRIKRHKITKSPVFIIGFWRSGTTLLHNLLCRASDAAYVTTFQTVFPHVILTQSFWLKQLARYMMPDKRPVDGVRMGLDFPQEEEIALANMHQQSFYHFYFFPRDFESICEKGLFFSGCDDVVMVKWKSAYLYLIKKAMLNTKGSRLISKSPSNMVRIQWLLDMFPDAKFIFIYRNPYNTIESTSRFFNAIMPALQLQYVEKHVIAGNIIRLYNECMKKYDRDKVKIPPNQLIEIRYEDLEKDKLAWLDTIYHRLEIPGFDDELPAFRSYLEEVDSYKQNTLDLSQETIQLVNEHLQPYIDRWGYEKI